MAHLHLRKSKKVLMLVLALIVVISSVVASVAVFTDRVNRTTTIQVSTFDDDGYAIKRTAPDGYFTAGETIEATLNESNTKSENITSQITMTVAWESPVPGVYPWGNTTLGNAVITLDGETVPYTVNSNNTITFTLPERALAAKTSDITSSLKFQIPSDLASTGKLSFNFDKIELGYANWTAYYNNTDLDSLDFNVSVAWNISKKQTTAAGNPNRDVIAVLTEGTVAGQYGLEVIKNGSNDNTNNGQMMDWSAKDQTPWASYPITELTIDEGVTSVGDYAFAGEAGIIALDFPSTMTDIGTSAFDGIGLSGELVVPASIEKIESLAFGNLPNVTAITFEHTSDDNLSLPNNTAAGKETSGAFYVPNYVKTTFDFNGNSDAEKYNWVADNRMKVGITDAELTYEDVVIGQTVDPGLVILPDDHDDYQSIHYEVIEGDEYATVDPDTGVVTGVAQGTATIQVTIVDANGDEVTAQGTVNILGIGITDATLAYDDVVIGQTVDPDLDVLPENHGPYQSIHYEVTEGSKFASVNPDTGIVTGLAQGTATIKVTIIDTNDKEITAEGTVNVLGIGITSATLDYDDVVVGQTVDPDLTIDPANHDKYQSIQYEVVDGDTYASVDPDTGVVTGLAQGTATIRVTIVDTNGKTVIAEADVNILGIGITNATLDYDDVVVGQTVDPDLTIDPANHDKYQSIQYEVVDGDTYASVDPDTGVVTGLAQGTATIQVTIVDTNGKTVTAEGTVNVLGIGITNATLDYDDVAVGQTVDPDLTIDPANHDKYQSIQYEVVDGDTYVSVDPDTGVVTGLAPGTATIRVTIVDTNGKTVIAEGTVNVYLPVPTLAANCTWFDPATEFTFEDNDRNYNYAREYIDYITFKDKYVPTGSELISWDASEAKNKSVMAYIVEDSDGYWELILSGNGYGKIFANADSSLVFSHSSYDDDYPTDLFWCVQSIYGLELFDTSNATTMKAMFAGIDEMTTLDLSLPTLNTEKVTDMSDMFHAMNFVTSIDVSGLDTANVTNMSGMFDNCFELEALDLSTFNTAKVTDMSHMFSGNFVLADLDISSFNTSKLENAAYMFSSCYDLEGIDFPATFTTGELVNMEGMFAGCQVMTKLDLAQFDTAKVENMSYLFSRCEALTDLNISSFETGSVTNMESMFNFCSALTTLDLTHFVTNKVEDMSYMFNYCSSLTTIYATHRFNTDAVTDSASMFREAPLIVGGAGTTWSKSSVDKTRALVDGGTSNPGYFTNNIFLTYKDVNVGETTNAQLTIKSAVFDDYTSIAYEVISGDTYVSVNATTGKVTGLAEGTATIQVTLGAANGDTITALAAVTVHKPVPTLAEKQTWYTQGLTTIDKTTITSIDIVDSYDTSGKTIVSSWDASAGMTGTVTAYVESAGSGSTYKLTLAGNGYGKIFANADSTSAFRDFTALTTVNGANILDTSNTTTMLSMFNTCEKLTTVDTSNWDTSKVEDMAYMFVECGVLKTVDVSNWDTSKVLDFDSMFSYCYKLNSLDVSRWDTGRAESMQYMFNFCESLPTVDVSNWDVSNVTDTSAMFQSCSVLETLDVSKWTFSTKLTDASAMFNHCKVLKALSVENWIMDNVVYLDTMFNHCETLTTLGVDNWNVGSAKKMDLMFAYCTSMTSLNVSNWDTSSAANMEKMFRDSLSLTTLAVDDWDVSSVTNMKAMFLNCSGLINLNVSDWSTSALQEVTGKHGEVRPDASYYWDLGMFEGCSGLSVIDISGWDMDQITNTAHMFSGCTNLKSLTIPASLKNISPEFAYNCTNLTKINFLHDSTDTLTMPPAGEKTADDFTTANEYGVYSDGGAFYVPSYVQTTFDFNGNTTAQGYDWATDNRLLNIPTLAAADTWFTPSNSAITESTISSVTLMNSYTPTGTLVDSWPAAVDADGDGSLDSDIMVYVEDDGLGAGTYKLTIAGNGNPAGIFYANEDSSRAFWLFSAMTSFNNSSVMDTSKVKYMGHSMYSNYGMFQGCKSLTSLDLSSWDTSKVQSTISLFYACTNLKDLNITGWDMSSCKRMVYMFSDCLALETVDIGNWNTSKVVEMAGMFEDSTAINYLDVATKEVTVDGVTYTAWNVGKVTDMGSMFRNCESLPTLDVSNWDVGKVEDMLNLFSGCDIIDNLDVSKWNTGSVKDFRSTFGGCNSLSSLDVSNWNTSSATTMGGMFSGCESLPTLNVTNWNVSLVEDMGGLFSGCDIINGMDMSKWDTSSVKDMSSMFSMCYALVDPTVQNFDTSAVEDMEAMFYQCHSIQTLDLSNWVTSKVTAMAQDGTHNGMFYECNNLTTIYATHRFDVSNVTESDYMFGECLKLVGGAGTAYSSANDDKAYAHVDGGTANPGYFTNHIFLSYNDVPVGETVNAQLTIKSAVFDDYTSIAYEVISGNDYATVNTTSGKVTGVAKGAAIIQVTLGAANGDTITAQAAVNVTGPIPILASGGSWFNPTNANVTRPKITSITFADTYTPSSTPADSWDASDKKNNSVTAYAEDDGLGTGTYKLTIAGNGYGCIFANAMSAYAFGGIQDEDQFSAMTSFNDPDKVFNTSMATSMSRMFEEAVALKTIDAGHWDTSNVDSMHMLFFYCESLESVDVSNWDMRNVETLHWAFDNCESLTTLDTSNWTFTKLTDLYGTFYGCRKLATLDVSNWDVSKVTTLQDTFSSCRSLKVIDVSKWNTQNVECMDYTFQYCVSLETVPVGNWNTGKCTSMDYMFAYCEALTNLDVATKAVAAGTLGTDSAAYTAWDVSQVKTLTATFIDCEKITFLDVSDWTTTALVNTIKAFDGCVKLATLDVSGWNMSSVKQAYCMFTDCQSLAVIDVSNWDTSSLTQIHHYVYSANNADLGMFENCINLKTVDLSSWNMSQITNTAHMFYNCTNLESIIIPASAAHISAEFAYNCPNLTSIIFLHSATDTLNMPSAGEKTSEMYPSGSEDNYGVYSDGGAFYVPSSVETIVNSNGNAAVTSYDWKGDNRTVASTAAVTFMDMLGESKETAAEDSATVDDSNTSGSDSEENADSTPEPDISKGSATEDTNTNGSDANQNFDSENGADTVNPDTETDSDSTSEPDFSEDSAGEDTNTDGSDANQNFGSENGDDPVSPDTETDSDSTSEPDFSEDSAGEDTNTDGSDANQNFGSENGDDPVNPDTETDSDSTTEPDFSEDAAGEDTNTDSSDANQDSNSDVLTETEGSESSLNQDPAGEVTTTPDLSIPDEIGTVPEEIETDPVITPEAVPQVTDS